jgi:hypothetical protein
MRATLTHVVRVRPVRTQRRRTSATRACAQLATSVMMARTGLGPGAPLVILELILTSLVVFLFQSAYSAARASTILSQAATLRLPA